MKIRSGFVSNSSSSSFLFYEKEEVEFPTREELEIPLYSHQSAIDMLLDEIRKNTMTVDLNDPHFVSYLKSFEWKIKDSMPNVDIMSDLHTVDKISIVTFSNEDESIVSEYLRDVLSGGFGRYCYDEELGYVQITNHM